MPKPRKPRKPSRALTYGDLPDPAGDAFIYCPSCGSRWSATRGDYFMCDPTKPIVCGSPGCHNHPLLLARKRDLIVSL